MKILTRNKRKSLQIIVNIVLYLIEILYMTVPCAKYLSIFSAHPLLHVQMKYKMGNPLLAAGDISHKYIVVERRLSN